jgi:hypothetical protein
MKRIICIAIVLSAMVSTPIWCFLNINYWLSFVALFSMLIALWVCFATIVKTNYSFKLEKLRSDEFIAAMKQTIRCKCAYCKTETDHLINLQKAVQSFRCKKCDKNNRVIFNFEVAQISDSHNIS